MKTFRNSLYLLVGLMLSTWLVFANAETIPATANSVPKTTVYYFKADTGTASGNYDTAQSAGDAAKSASSPASICTGTDWSFTGAAQNSSCSGPPSAGNYIGAIRTRSPDGATGCGSLCSGNSGNRIMLYSTQGCVDPAVASGANCVTYSCPANQSWSLSGSTCFRADCQPGETRNASGQCTSVCQNLASNTPEYGWITSDKGSDPTGTFCGDQNCQATISLDTDADIYYYTATQVTMRYSKSYTGQTCTGGQAPAATKNTVEPPTPPKKPVCAANEGVLTTSKGTVACVPPGTPSAETPKVAVKKRTETFGDGSQKITTETITEVPSTQAKDVQTSVQVTPNSAGTAGQAGTPGTTGSGSASVTDSNGDGAGDGGGGDCDPKKDFCGGPATGGLYEKKSKTVASVVGDFKTGLMSSGIGSAMTGFFTVSTPGGSCPSWIVDVAFLNTTLNLSQYFCTATAISMMQLVGAVLMFVAAFVGFRWAIL